MQKWEKVLWGMELWRKRLGYGKWICLSQGCFEKYVNKYIINLIFILNFIIYKIWFIYRRIIGSG